MKISVVRSLSDFHAAVGGDMSRSGQCLSVFRGQRDATWPLVPAIVREPRFHGKASLTKNLNNPNDKSDERRLITLFRDLAVSLLPQWTFHGSPQEVLWKHILLSQHYRVPTRLLDWSTNPLVALFFAVRGAVTTCDAHCHHDKELCDEAQRHHSAVYVLRSRESFSVAALAARNPKAPFYTHRNDPGIIRPPSIDRRFIAQSSVFAISRKPEVPIEPDAEVLIEADARDRILQELDVYGINASTMFPDLEHLGEYLEWFVPSSR